jgi:hypothetical protein
LVSLWVGPLSGSEVESEFVHRILGDLVEDLLVLLELWVQSEEDSGRELRLELRLRHNDNLLRLEDSSVFSFSLSERINLGYFTVHND